MQIENLSSSISLLSQYIVLSPGSPALQLDASSDNEHRGKRRRLDSEGTQQSRRENPSSAFDGGLDVSTHFLTGPRLEALLDAYFMNIHPWIPMIHMTTFRRKVQGRDEAAEAPLLSYAMLAAVLPLLNVSGGHLSADRIEREVERLKTTVITRATNSITVENLQALIIVAFTHVSPMFMT